MHNSFKKSNTLQGWEAELKDYQLEVKLHGHEMSPYERNLIQREIRKRQDELIPTLGAVIIGEFHTAVGKYQDANLQLEGERTKEINRWDAGKLNTEMQLMQTRVQLALKQDVNPVRGADTPVSVRLQALYSEALQSGDLYKQRAAIETLRSAPLPIGNTDERIQINALTKDVERAETALRQTPGMEQAQAARIDALGELHNKHTQLDKASQLLGMGGTQDIFALSPFAKAARLVEFTAEGPVIYDANDPKVTGVYQAAANVTAGGNA